jgi:thioredoxin reductase (NADPH)
MTATETPDLYGAYPRLTDAQISTLAGGGQRRPTRRGERLASAGAPSDMFYVVLRGQVAVIEEPDEDTARVLGVHGPRRFLGELGLLEGQVSFVTMEVRVPGSVLAVPAPRLHDIVTKDPVLADVILRACLIRRSLLVGRDTGFRIIGSCFAPDTRRLREFAARNRLPHRWIDPERDPQAENLLRRFRIGIDEMPIVIWHGSEILRNPSNMQLARLIGMSTAPPAEAIVDLLVIGAGPAGLAATVYGASDGLDTRLLDTLAAGGQAATSARIENYLGFPAGISGAEFAERAVVQAKKFDARLHVPATAAGIEPDGGYYRVPLAGGRSVLARTVVIATGMRYRRLRMPRLREFENSSVHYAATQVEAQLCAGQPVAVVGGGNSAGQAALYLATHAAQVYLLVREPDLDRNMSRYLVDQIERDSGVTVLCGREVCEAVGGPDLEALVVRDNRTGECSTITAREMFVFIGAEPCTGWLADAVALDPRGYVVTGPEVTNGAWEAVQRRPLTLETSRPGVFAVGDVRSGSVKRMTSAVGEGAMAVRMAVEHLRLDGGLTRS